MDAPPKRALSAQPENAAPASCDSSEARPAKCKRTEAAAASQRHIRTEQARRDKISAGFQALQQLLPGREKVEKAMLLSQAADYIQQLQGVLKLLMSSGAISKLPDDLQFQIRTLLPRKDHVLAAAAAPPAPAVPTPAQAAPAPALPQLPALSGAGLLPFLPLVPQAPAVPELGKELPADETALTAQIQALLQQQQQQAAAMQQQQAAAQQMQSFLQALQLQQALQQQQQQQPSLSVPDLMASLAAGSSAPPPAALSLPPAAFPTAAAAAQTPPAQPLPAPVPRRPGCFAADLPKCGLQQLVDAAACEPSSTLRPARKSVKVRRHTTAARIPKPEQEQQQAPAHADGRPGPV